MCIWNRRNPEDRVHFLGFDEQQSELDHAALKGHLKRFRLPANDVRVRGMDASCSLSIADRLYDQEDYDECVKRLDQLSRYFDRREKVLIQRTSAEELEWARLRLLGLRAWQVQHFGFQPRQRVENAIAARDHAMARIFPKRRELQFPDLKIAIWAHNFHINERGLVSFGDPTMGDCLAEALGDDYVTLALIGYEVAIDWPGIGCGVEPVPTSADAVETRMHDLGEDVVLVDLDFPGTDAPFLEPGTRYLMSAEHVVPRDHYDGFFFLDSSRKMSPLAWPSCE